MYLSFGAIYLKFGAIYPSLLKLFNTYILVSYRPKLKLKKKGGLKYCTICPDSVFEKHVLLHNSGSWLIRVRFIHSWAAGTITLFWWQDCFLAGIFCCTVTDRLRFAAILNRWCMTPWRTLMKPRDRALIDSPISVHESRFDFCWGIGPCGPVPPPPLEWNSILPLITAV